MSSSKESMDHTLTPALQLSTRKNDIQLLGNIPFSGVTQFLVSSLTERSAWDCSNPSWGKSMKTIVLVSCVSKKQNISLPAKDLYISDWFQKASAYARRIGDHWFILSAKYGLLPPDKVIEPYNITLKSLPKYQRQVWAKRVMQDLLPQIAPKDTIVFLAGQVTENSWRSP